MNTFIDNGDLKNYEQEKGLRGKKKEGKSSLKNFRINFGMTSQLQFFVFNAELNNCLGNSLNPPY